MPDTLQEVVKHDRLQPVAEENAIPIIIMKVKEKTRTIGIVIWIPKCIPGDLIKEIQEKIEVIVDRDHYQRKNGLNMKYDDCGNFLLECPVWTQAFIDSFRAMIYDISKRLGKVAKMAVDVMSFEKKEIEQIYGLPA